MVYGVVFLIEKYEESKVLIVVSQKRGGNCNDPVVNMGCFMMQELLGRIFNG